MPVSRAASIVELRSALFVPLLVLWLTGVLCGCGSAKGPKPSVAGRSAKHIEALRNAEKFGQTADALAKLAEIAPEGLSDVQRVFADHNIPERWVFVEQYFANTADPEVSEALVAAVSDEDEGVRQDAIRFISSDTVSSCVPALAEAIRKHPGSRTWAIYALRRVASPAAFDVIRSLGTHSNSGVREIVALVLHGDTSGKTREVLELLSRDKQKWVSMTALSSMLGNGFITSGKGRAIAQLQEFADTLTGKDRLDALILLTRTKAVRASALLAKVIPNSNQEDRQKLVFEARYLPREGTLSDVLLLQSRSGSIWISSWAVSTLALQGEPKVIEVAQRLSKRYEVTNWARAYAFRKLKGGSTAQLVEIASGPEPACYEALIALVERGAEPSKYAKAKEKLMNDSTSRSVFSRMMAAYVLRNIHQEWAKIPLEELRQDWNRDVRMVARTGCYVRDIAGPPGQSDFEATIPFFWPFSQKPMATK